MIFIRVDKIRLSTICDSNHLYITFAETFPLNENFRFSPSHASDINYFITYKGQNCFAKLNLSSQTNYPPKI